VGGAYDAVTALTGRSGPLITLDAELFASVVTDAEIRQTERAASAGISQGGAERPMRIVWAGRMAREKGLTELVTALKLVRETGRDVTLVLIGDGPARKSLEPALRRLPADRVEDYGYVGNRAFYMDLLRGGDLLVHPSRAEGVPKVLIEAMAGGLPIVAADAGAVPGVLGDGERGRIVPAGDTPALAATIAELLDDRRQRLALRERGLAWAADHTAEAQARRLVSRLQALFPGLDWRHPAPR
jgi:glycosyltransferase involved in cell wall biosynthesis